MAPPPPAATPSPNRFIFKKPRSNPAPSQHAIDRPTISDSSVTTPQSTQFARVPRFSNPASRAALSNAHAPRSVSPNRLHFSTPGSVLAAPKALDEVHDASQTASNGAGPEDEDGPQNEVDAQAEANDNDDDDEMLDNLAPDISPTFLPRESRNTSPPHSPVSPRSQKRPRLSHPSPLPPACAPSKPPMLQFIPPAQSSRLAPFLPPPDTLQPFSQPPTPFLSSTVATSTAIAAATSTMTSTPIISNHRPTFLKPTLPPPVQQPLPEMFSPHRRGQRYMPGGLAAGFAGWVVEVGEGALNTSRGREGLGGGMSGATSKVGSGGGTTEMSATGEFVRIIEVSGIRDGEELDEKTTDYVGERDRDGSLLFLRGVEVSGLQNGVRDGRSREGIDGYENTEEGIVWVLLVDSSGAATTPAAVGAAVGNPGSGRSPRDRRKVLRGSIIGIRAPSWVVELEGRNWIVGVDWRLLP